MIGPKWEGLIIHTSWGRRLDQLNIKQWDSFWNPIMTFEKTQKRTNGKMDAHIFL